MANDRKIAYMEIDLNNKTKEELEDEVVQRVKDMISRKKEEIRNGQFITGTEYLIAQLEIEEEKILKQFIFQIRHMDEIEEYSNKIKK